MKESTQILVIGGGPAGSYAATALRREGFDVTLIEAAIFPRYHIGESLLPSARQFLTFIGAEDKVSKFGFTNKPGAAVKLNQHNREGYTDFISLDSNNGAWNVVRSEFDNLLLQHAAECGTSVYQGIKITRIEFDAPGGRPVGAVWQSADATGTIRFEWLIDASGRAGILSTKYLHNRRFTESLRNIALWAYWRDAGRYAPGTNRENAPWFEALTDESGWAWFIPLHDGTVSVGVVQNEGRSKLKKAQLHDSGSTSLTHAFYIDQISLAPGLRKLLGDASLATSVKSASDFSYNASSHAGPGYRIVGDAGAFIDPFFSSGVHLAFGSALSAAATIAASARGDCAESSAVEFHNARVGMSYTRFLLVVLSIYKQIGAQDAPVLHDIDETNFDRAFNLLRPVIQGAADVGKQLTENEIDETMKMCRNLFAPTGPEMYDAVARRVEPSLLDTNGPLLTPDQVSRIVGVDDDARSVINEINARKQIHTMYDPVADAKLEAFNGLVMRVEKGCLGLQPVD